MYFESTQWAKGDRDESGQCHVSAFDVKFKDVGITWIMPPCLHWSMHSYKNRVKQWLDTILKAGEVLRLPSHWFQYVVSLQKSAYCNLRSGVNIEGDSYFGGQVDVCTR